MITSISLSLEKRDEENERKGDRGREKGRGERLEGRFRFVSNSTKCPYIKSKSGILQKHNFCVSCVIYSAL